MITVIFEYYSVLLIITDFTEYYVRNVYSQTVRINDSRSHLFKYSFKAIICPLLLILSITKGNLTKQERDLIIFLRNMKLLFLNSDTLLMLFISYVREDIYVMSILSKCRFYKIDILDVDF